jgi:S-adenosylmethionine-diacylglycerol 3-amino-3-carboxypropyl transferase
MTKQIINYSQCWEDPVVLNEALSINSQDIILSITSGGDNTLALLLKTPKKVISIDLNPLQKYLIELKISAIRALNYGELLDFLIFGKSSRKEELFIKVNKYLSVEAASWWNRNRSLIKQGVIYIGRFERFLKFFRCYILPLIHSKKITEDFLNTSSIQIQRDFYKNTWNSKRWRLFFKIITSRFILRSFARQQGMFTYTEPGAIAKEYLKRLDWNFNAILLKSNYFMNYCLLGRYGQSLPPYLEEKNYIFLKENFSSLSMITDDLLSYLKSMPDDSFSKFNLSDVFESLSPEQNNILWKEIVRTAKNEARVVYWNNLVYRTFPQDLSANIKNEDQLANQLHLKDRVFFYGDFKVNRITK